MFRSRTPPDAAEAISKMLAYPPEQRLHAFEALADPFFDELRDPAATLSDGRDAARHFPPLFNFTAQELSYNPAINHVLIPEHARHKGNWPPPVPVGGTREGAAEAARDRAKAKRGALATSGADRRLAKRAAASPRARGDPHG